MITIQNPESKLGKAIGVPELYLKREDLHPYGSHKGRSIPYMIDFYAAKGDKKFVISSSGNAALAAMLHTRKLNETGAGLELDVYVGNHIDPHKLEKLKKHENEQVRVLRRERPLQALSQATDEGLRSLRQSTDDVALMGYKSLAEELAQIPKLCAVFIGTSSGTTAQALAQFFASSPKNVVQVHIVQTSSCHPMSAAFETYDGDDERSIADAIVDQTAHRKEALIPLIKKTGGSGWFATNEQITAARELVERHADLDISTNSALSIVGVMQAVYRGATFDGTVACILGGD